MNKTIVIVEDNKDINQLLSNFLKENGYNTISFLNGQLASKGLKESEYDLVLMDLMLPYIGGEHLIREIRTYSNVPVIVLSAKSMMETKLEVLRLGADDYIMKPFDLDEVLVRIEVVLRRSNRGEEKDNHESTCYQYGTLKMIEEEHKVFHENTEISLTAKEYELLKQFLKAPQKTFTKANLYEAVWNDVYYYEDNTINVHMSNLRSKLKKVTGKDYIVTVWGIGYRLNEKPGGEYE